jgi:cyclopropane-fatty-acyl-phospholipid synthase
MTGASADAIRRHYDVGNEFFALWLDDATMSYTAALYDGDAADELGRAQERKIDHHAAAVGAAGAARILDIGCGWGNLLGRLVASHGVQHAVGLTLSPSQAAWIARRPDPRVEVRVESWADHAPAAPYDAILSIEAIEAFVRPGLARAEKVQQYRALFERCHAWLVPGGRLALQTSAYGNATPDDLDSFISSQIFEESDLPALAELVEASERLFEIVTLRNDRADYARTLRAWLARLTARRGDAIALVGEATVARYEKYLRLSIYMFVSGGCDLFRIALRRIDRPRHRSKGPRVP